MIFKEEKEGSLLWEPAACPSEAIDIIAIRKATNRVIELLKLEEIGIWEMTEEQLDALEFDPQTQPAEWHAQFTVEAWESRFPGVLCNSGRYLLYHFILDALKTMEEIRS